MVHWRFTQSRSLLFTLNTSAAIRNNAMVGEKRNCSLIGFCAPEPGVALGTWLQEADYRLFLIEQTPQFRYRESPVEAGYVEAGY